jgi:hypothetical protein
MRNVWPLKFSGSIFYALLLVFVAILLAGAMFYFISCFGGAPVWIFCFAERSLLVGWPLW